MCTDGEVRLPHALGRAEGADAERLDLVHQRQQLSGADRGGALFEERAGGVPDPVVGHLDAPNFKVDVRAGRKLHLKAQAIISLWSLNLIVELD